jgi:teichuronic acid biosynthesis glycosyltransferase TuaG
VPANVEVIPLMGQDLTHQSLDNPNQVSVVMPAYNAEATIEKAITSVQSQTYKNWQLIIVDDGSEDSTYSRAINLSAQDDRILVIKNTANRGVAESRNVALRAATGRFIAFLDADDIWFSRSLEQRVNVMNTEGVSVVSAPYVRALPNGKTSIIASKSQIWPRDMYYRNHIGNLTGMYDRRALGMFMQSPIRHEDYLMWCQVIQRAGYAISSLEPIGVYNATKESLSGNKLRSAIWHWQVLRNGLKLRFLPAVFYQTQYFFWHGIQRLKALLF